MKTDLRSEELKTFNEWMKRLHPLWIPLRLFMYYIFYTQYTILCGLWAEEKETSTGQKYYFLTPWLLFSFYCLSHSVILYHMLCSLGLYKYIPYYKLLPSYFHSPKFHTQKQPEKRFSKIFIKSASQDLMKLLSFSHKNTNDLANFIESSERTQISRCDICNDVKPSSMSHWQLTNKCVFKYDHYTPVLNNSVSLTNVHYFMALYFYLWATSLMLFMILITYTDSKFWTENSVKCTLMAIFSAF